MEFADRVDAGRLLAAKLPVALEVARALDAPLDVIVVRKLGVPFQPELGMGAIGEGGVRVLNAGVVRLARVSSDELAAVEQRERVELERRARRFRGDRPPVRLDGKTVVVVDDGIATGSTARAACQVARAQGASRIGLAVPVAPPDWTDRLAGDADEEEGDARFIKHFGQGIIVGGQGGDFFAPTFHGAELFRGDFGGTHVSERETAGAFPGDI